jgi:thiol-disulfide isomerase/thioredoxin
LNGYINLTHSSEAAMFWTQLIFYILAGILFSFFFFRKQKSYLKACIALIVYIITTGPVYLAYNDTLTLTDINGNSINIKRYNHKWFVPDKEIYISRWIGNGQWVVINYWSSMCDTCIAEIPELNAFYDAHHGNIILFSVDNDQEPLDKIKVITAKLGMHYPTITNDPAAHFGLPAIKGVPTTFLISPQGKIQPALEGGVTHQMLDQKMEFYDDIDMLLKDKAK